MTPLAMPEVAVPIVNVEIIGGEEPAASTVQRMADEMGEVFNSGPGRTWIKVSRLSETGYAENGRPGVAGDYAPVFVDVARSGRSRNQGAEARARGGSCVDVVISLNHCCSRGGLICHAPGLARPFPQRVHPPVLQPASA